MENKEQSLIISDIINNDKLRGSLYSSFKCSLCGKKLIARALGNELHLVCEEHRYSMIPTKEKNHDIVKLDLKEIAAILNFNPLL